MKMRVSGTQIKKKRTDNVMHNEEQVQVYKPSSILKRETKKKERERERDGD